jgi:hypothetical protein
MKIKVQVKQHGHKMDAEELQEYLKLKRGNGAHKSKKDYNRQSFKMARCG